LFVLTLDIHVDTYRSLPIFFSKGIILICGGPLSSFLALGIFNTVLYDTNMLDGDKFMRTVLGDSGYHSVSVRIEEHDFLSFLPASLKVRAFVKSAGPLPVGFVFEHHIPDFLCGPVDGF